MALVGDFGAAKAEADPDREPEQFGFFGEVFTITPRTPGVGPLMDFAEAAQSDDTGLKGLVAMKGLLRSCIAGEDFDRFWQSVIRNDVDAELLMHVCDKVYEVISGRPTVSPTGSAGGRSTTSQPSRSRSSRHAELGLVPVDEVSLTG